MRLKKEDVIGHGVRGRIYQIIVSNPGIHFRAIQREYRKDNYSQLHTGGLCYHIDVLEYNGLIKSNNDGYKKRFYITGQPMEKIFPELLLEKIENYYYIHKRGITKKELMEAFGVSERVVRYNIKKISSKLIVRKDGKIIRYYPHRGKPESNKNLPQIDF